MMMFVFQFAIVFLFSFLSDCILLNIQIWDNKTSLTPPSLYYNVCIKPEK